MKITLVFTTTFLEINIMASSTQPSTRRSSISAQKSDRRRRRSPHLDDDLEIEVPPLKELEIGHSWDSLQQAKDGVKA
jgi:hypothetical protein